MSEPTKEALAAAYKHGYANEDDRRRVALEIDEYTHLPELLAVVELSRDHNCEDYKPDALGLKAICEMCLAYDALDAAQRGNE